ncbi:MULTISPECIES: heavy metal translocating P-type ATPase [unclassified Treponema]|uniref:heavy metal translocating P-type ATPase n=1 Tax=unclassified Treponema TaxID=2638727 RepID=UPI0020A42DBB|nr:MULTISPECIES: heavy metal translocating P-type ATPase [unclassified Treponema]UTC68262.1 heavy metal translocating P-type ATPase [Treponema sp. OMZ 789]UTC70982.1 heavy metal translocating P-type ATPase [Treponema sp. OMZ 790]UTC73722.1 heavy metal translocating P-type ATPase [Treponema sp. OMZ 791]
MDFKKENEHNHDEHKHEHDEHCSCGHEHHSHDEHCSCGHEHNAKDYSMRGHEHHAKDYRMRMHDHHGHNHDEHCCSHDHHDHSGCGCEHHHGSSKEMIVQFGISAILFAAGIFTRIFLAETVIQIQNFKFAFSTLLFVIAWFVAGYKVLLTSLKNILKGQIFDENFLMTVATIGAFILGDWTEGAAVMLFYNLGEVVQHLAVEKSRRSIIDLMDLRPDFARIYKPGEEEKLVDPSKVEVGSLVLVKAGEKIPLDGIIYEGSAELDTSSMTGESLPRTAEKDSPVLAGFVNLTGMITVKTTASLENTAASKMLELIESAQNRKARVERFITSFAKIYTPIVTIGAVLLSVLPPLLSALIFSSPINGWESFAPWISRGLVFLVISCPCAFVISVPLGYFGGIGGAAKRGILIKGADYVDALSKTDAVVFDKTGTLTKGVLKVLTLMPADNVEKDEFLKLAALAELNSHHPIAKAVQDCALINLSEEVTRTFKEEELTDYYEKAGKGISVKYKGKTLLAGKNSFISENIGKEIPLYGDEIGGTQVYAAYDGEYIGCLILTDTLKNEAREAIADLNKLGLSRVEILTGDNEKSAKKIAEDLGIKNYTAMLLPHEKVSRFEEISDEVKAKNKKASVVFVGDGINDAPVLARADAGIAMGGIGSDAAIEAADIVLMNDNPRLVAAAVKQARFTRKIVWQNIALAFGIKIGFLTLGALGLTGLWAAVFADVGVALLAVFNSLRAKR